MGPTHKTLILVTMALGLSCHDPATTGPRTPAHSTCGDLAPREVPSFAVPPRALVPESRVTLDLGVTVERIERELSERIPTVLDRGSRGIGRAGRLGYVVRRGPFAVALEGERLVVSTMVTVNAQVCKPLGPFCPTYGSCSPKLKTRVSVPLVLEPDYRLGEAQVAIDIERSCSIAGFDATPQIRGTARRQASQVKRQIDAIVNRPPPEAQRVWQALGRPLPLPDGSCLGVTLRSVAQARPRLEAGTLSTQATITGALSFEQPCADVPSTTTQPASLPEPQVVDRLPPGVALSVGLRRDWTDLSAELTESLRAAPGSTGDAASAGLTLTSVVARGVLLQDERLVALTLRVEECGEQLLVGELALEAKTHRAKLRGLRSPMAGVALDGPLQALAKRIERQAVVTIPMDLDAATTTLQQLKQQVTSLAPADVELEVELEPAVLTNLEIDGDGLLAIASLEGRLGVRLR